MKLLLLLVLTLLTSRAESAQDVQGWLHLEPSVVLAKKTKLIAVFQWRFGRGNQDQVLTDVNLRHQFPSFSLSAGLTSLSFNRPLFNQAEWRPWIGVLFAGRLSHRIHFEWRDFAGPKNAVARLRYRFGKKWTWNYKHRFIFVDNEVMFHLNNGAVPSGFDQNRLRLGISWQLMTRYQLQLFYMNQWIHRSSELFVHVPSLTLVIAL